MKSIGIIFILLALAIGIVPQFTNCTAQGRAITLPNGRTTPMKCYWTAMAELAVAVPLLAVGGLVLTVRQKEARRALSFLGALSGAFALLLPTSLIGVCAGDEMLCNILMRPLLILSGLLALAAGLAGMFLAGRKGAERYAGGTSAV